MAFSVYDLLGYVPLMEPVQIKLGGLPKVLPEKWFTIKEDVPQDECRVVTYNGTRKVARVAPYGAPPRQVEKPGIGTKEIKLLHSIEKLAYRQEMYRILQAWDDYKPQQKFFEEQLVFMGEIFAQRQMNLRIAAITSVLANGVIYFDIDGNLLPNSTGAQLTIDFGVPAGNKGQVGGIIDVSWDNPAANIVTQINALKTKALQTTGRPLKVAYYSRNVMGYLMKNTTMQTYLSRNAVFNQQMTSTGQIPAGLLDIEQWIPVQDAFFENDAGTIVENFPVDQITFTPDLDRSWYTMYEGGYPVPRSFGLAGDAKAMLDQVDYVYGMGRYAYLEVNPISLHETQFDTFLPAIRVPESVFIVDTTF